MLILILAAHNLAQVVSKICYNLILVKSKSDRKMSNYSPEQMKVLKAAEQSLTTAEAVYFLAHYFETTEGHATYLYKKFIEEFGSDVLHSPA